MNPGTFSCELSNTMMIYQMISQSSWTRTKNWPYILLHAVISETLLSWWCPTWFSFGVVCLPCSQRPGLSWLLLFLEKKKSHGLQVCRVVDMGKHCHVVVGEILLNAHGCVCGHISMMQQPVSWCQELWPFTMNILSHQDKNAGWWSVSGKLILCEQHLASQRT